MIALNSYRARCRWRRARAHITNTMDGDGTVVDGPYSIEDVPYVQYFNGGIALHSAYWHDRFGHRASHGCVNLSPLDSAYVYSLTSPHPRDGWIEVYEDEGDLGTRVRVREGTAAVADRRGSVEHVQG